MYEFLDRLCTTSWLARRGAISGVFAANAFDAWKLHDGPARSTLFPEIDYTRVDKIKGMNITLTRRQRTTKKAANLLKLLGVPLAPAGLEVRLYLSQR